jgi:hypothetical protein
MKICVINTDFVPYLCRKYKNDMRVRRKTIYKTKRERLLRDIRNMKLIFIFGTIALVFWIFFKWREITDWFILTF